jgi:hypothetical protein
VDAELARIGYDAAAHDAARRKEQAGRAAEEQLRLLETARAALAPLQREIESIELQIKTEEAKRLCFSRPMHLPPQICR